jgi:DNA-binding HxlR family transcriptional regulator
VTPSLNVHYKNSRIKQYHKENRALRTETTINNTYDFGVGKRLHNLSKLREIGFAANRRLIEIERLSHDCILSEDTFQAINRPVAAGRQRASGLRFADHHVHALLHALILFRQLAEGFRAADLRRHLAALSGNDPASISQGAITDQLRRLRLHGLIERVPNSFRYRITDFGLRIALFFTRTYNRLLRPALVAALPTLGTVATPLQRAFNALTVQIDTTIRKAQLASEGADLSAFVDQCLILARGQPARLLAKPPVGRLAMWPGPSKGSYSTETTGAACSRQQQLTLVSNDEPFRFAGAMALLKK